MNACWEYFYVILWTSSKQFKKQAPAINHVIPRFWPHGIKIVHDVNIVIKSWQGAHGQGPTIDLVFCVSTIKIHSDGYSSSQEQYILIYHVNIQFNKIPTTSYALQWKRWGHDFTRNRKGIYPNPWANTVRLDVNGETHKPSATFLSSALKHSNLLEVGWGS